MMSVLGVSLHHVQLSIKNIKIRRAQFNSKRSSIQAVSVDTKYRRTLLWNIYRENWDRDILKKSNFLLQFNNIRNTTPYRKNLTKSKQRVTKSILIPSNS